MKIDLPDWDLESMTFEELTTLRKALENLTMEIDRFQTDIMKGRT